MTALMTRTPDGMAIGPDPHFALDDDGMPVYLGETEDEIGQDWDDTSAGITKEYWKLAAIASTIVTVYGEDNYGSFAKDHGTSARWIRDLATAYRTFQFGKRLPMLSITHHILALKAKNPVRAVKIAHDRNYSTREFKSWIYEGEGDGKLARTSDPPPPSALERPVEIIVEPDTDEDEEHISIVDEEMDQEDRELLVADLEMGLRMCTLAISKTKTRFALRYFENLQQELDWEIERLTKLPSALPARVEMYIRGGVWNPADLMARAKIKTEAELNRICMKLKSEGKIKWSREGKRKHGTAPELWMPSDMPDGGDFEVQHSGYRPDVEYDDDCS